MTTARKDKRRSRASIRGLSAIEAAIAVAIGGSLIAIAIPAFVRNVHSTYFAESNEGLARLSDHAIARAQHRATEDAFPRSAPITPSTPPRGHKEADAPGTWSNPTWIALDFQATVDGTPHAFAYGFDSTLAKGESTFIAHAHADLDGDGQMSTFEVHGRASDGVATKDPGMTVLRGLE